jgi:carboxymethylenebutenolidase
MTGHVWLPEGTKGPGILLLQEIFGVSPYIQRRAADLSAAGYVVLAPELYWRLDRQEVDEAAPDALEQAVALVGQLDWPTTVGDAVAAFTHLERMDEVNAVPGVIGFCFGGGLAFNVAAETDPAALVSYYGSALPDLLNLAPQVTCPSLYHFGTSDEYIDGRAVETITQAVTADGRPSRVELYDGANHAFDNDDFPLHHPEASRRAWGSTIDFLHQHLPV